MKIVTDGRSNLKRVITVSTLAVLVVLGASLWWWNADPERRFQFLKNETASCANCRKQFGMSLWIYAAEHENWFPKGKADPLESLALLAEHDPQFQVHVMTSHDEQTPLRRFWSDHRRLPEDLVCYRYNAGLRIEDPGDLILLYLQQGDSMGILTAQGPPGRATLHGRWRFLDIFAGGRVFPAAAAHRRVLTAARERSSWAGGWQLIRETLPDYDVSMHPNSGHSLPRAAAASGA